MASNGMLLGGLRVFASVPVLGRHLGCGALVAATWLQPVAAAPGGIEKVPVNLPPETILTSGPPDSTSATSYRVHFFWSGSDADGSVDHFDFIMVDHPRSKDSIGPGGTDPVVISVPAPDDPRWTSTTATDSVFVTLADTLRRDPRPGPGETPADVLLHPFERWHTFFIRAVDNAGMPDPTPDYRSFNSQDIAPTIALQTPIAAGTVFTGPSVIVFNWSGQDPVDEATTIEPVASRFVIIDSKVDINHQPNLYVSYPESLYVLPSRFSWSPWRSWEASDGSGRRAVVSDLSQLGDFAGAGYYIFAVQALDEAGAITPVFDWQTWGKNNVALVRVSGAVGPILTVREEFLGTQTFVGGSQPIRLDIAGGQPINFRWSADASHYGGEVVAYRYGWDIRPENDHEWTSWSSTNTSSVTRWFNIGSHRFFVQARDNAESITQAVYELTVHTLTQSRDLLWVDDSDYQTDGASESGEDSRWLSVLGQVAAAGALQFDSALDVYDVVENRGEPPPIQKVFDYKAVVWSCRSGSDASSGLRRAAQFVDPIPERNRNTASTFNILNIYLANGGRLWISGFRAAKQLWPEERERGHELDPVNVTNWDDPIEPHPLGVDSVGTTSLLYQMGIEMFDVGAGIVSTRNGREHYCTGLRPAAPGVPDLRVGTLWPQGGTSGRTNIEIYDMPRALATQSPPLVPPGGKTRVLYTYVSERAEDPSSGIFYPQTADNQPVFVMAKVSLQAPHSTMAFCGFEPYMLDNTSHTQLARHVLLQEMGLGPTAVFLQHLQAVVSDGAVKIRWEVDGEPAEFLLRARSGATEWPVPFAAAGDNVYQAVDDSPHLDQAETVIYSLYAREAGAQWVMLAQETVTLSAAPPLRLQLLPPQPNPFNPRVTIGFVLPGTQHVRITVYSPQGRRITTLLDAIRPAGAGSVSWDGVDAQGRPSPSGLYLALLESSGSRLSRRLVLLK